MAPINFNEPLFVFVVAAFALIGVGQTMHVFFCWYLADKNERSRSAAFVSCMCYEVSVLVVLLSVGTSFDRYAVALVGVLGVQVPVEVLACVGLLPVLPGLVSRALGNVSRLLPVELVLFATLPIAAFSGNGALYLVSAALVGGQLVYRTVACLLDDERLCRRTLTRFSVVGAVNLLPTGVLCLTRGGQSLIMNDAMRTSLVELELPVDTADLSGLWARLGSLALADERSYRYDEDCLLLGMPDGSYELFERGVMNWNGEGHVTITATDVTEEEELNRLLERSNELIVAAGEQIKASLEDVSRVARDEALLSLRAKVHDIIGQRLSILHRLLEDDTITDESLEVIKPLLNNLLDDLRIEDFDARDELEGIVSAFALIDVRVEVEGRLPRREDVARAFVAVIREAATNAVRHAQATAVHVRLAEREGAWTLAVANDLLDRQARPGEGVGIPNMRKAVEALGGTLEVSESPSFVVSARVPISRPARA